MAPRLNHVSVHARDLAESAEFYHEVFGFVPIPAPNFGSPVRWLRIGDLQLHLFSRESTAATYHHFGVEVDDLAQVLERARRRDALDGEVYGRLLTLLPDGAVQLYVRDPAGNLVEVIGRDVNALTEDLRARVEELAQLYPQDAEHRSATLFLDREPTGKA
jgi:catechol 2,3-dioxygenase-like lactoylglutathione lyase family enzyme